MFCYSDGGTEDDGEDGGDDWGDYGGGSHWGSSMSGGSSVSCDHTYVNTETGRTLLYYTICVILFDLNNHLAGNPEVKVFSYNVFFFTRC